MNVFMLGWEFPPYISGGLGTACYGLTRGLDRLGIRVQFVLPRAVDVSAASHVQIRSPASAAADGSLEASGLSFVPETGEFRHTEFHAVDAVIQPYARPEREISAVERIERATRGPAPAPTARPVTAPQAQPGTPPTPQGTSFIGSGDHYAGDLYAEVDRYAALASAVARRTDFDVIHAHDWMTYTAGIAVAGITRKPLVVHVHSTEFDRSGINVNQRIYDIERAGMHAATRVICVSYLTRNIVVTRYGVDPRRVEVVYNAIDENGPSALRSLPPIRQDEKIVLFLGRITMQKGPEYFLAAAKRVLEVMENVRFVMAGSGDMVRRVIELAAEMGIGHKVLFTGFLRGDDVARVFRMADLYVMPSVSEPFGITPLEALSNDVPVLISKQSGVAEMLTHALKVDFWDVDEMANQIVAVLRHPPLQATLRSHGRIEVNALSWTDSAARCVQVYRMAIAATEP